MNTRNKGTVHFLIYRDKGDSRYTAVCLDFDIVEHGKDLELLKQSIEEAASLHLESVIENKLSTSLLNRSAPQKYWKKLYEAMSEYESMLKEKDNISEQDEPSVSDIWNRNSKELVTAQAVHMGERLLIESPAQLRKRITKLGFVFDRSKGSHEQYICENRCHTVTLDNHKGKDMSKSDIRSMIRQSGCTKDEFYNGIKVCKK